MRYRILPAAVIAMCSLLTVHAQQNQTTAFAITSTEKGNFNWTDVKQIDLLTGNVTRTVFDSKQTNFTVYNARTLKEIKLTSVENGKTSTVPAASLSAACAYDQRHNRLYYAPLYMNQLRYIDLNAATPKIYYFENEQFTPVADMNSEGNHITRMVIAADGNGYALSNDGNHLLRFTTSRKPVITDLGAVQDDASNGQKSIHDKTIGWGGDMVADAADNLYVVSAYRHVFKINIQSKKATYVAEIQGLSCSFTTNGVVVDNEGNLIVSSANTAEGYYKVDVHTWQATRIDTKGTVFNASDLANGNFLFGNDKSSISLINRAVLRNDRIAIHPNPVLTNQLYVSFNRKESGRYTIQILDLTGRVITEKVVQVAFGGQVVPMYVYNNLAKGPYMVKVLNNGKKAIFTDQVIVQ